MVSTSLPKEFFGFMVSVVNHEYFPSRARGFTLLVYIVIPVQFFLREEMVQ